MSGTNERIINTDEVLFTIGEFDIVTAEFYTEETKQMEKGYAVVWKEDGIMQMLSNNIAASLNFAGGASQTLQMARSLVEQDEAAAETEGLIDEGEFGGDEELN